MANIWEQSPVDIFNLRSIKSIGSNSQSAPVVEIPVKFSDTSSLKNLTESENIVLPDRIILPIKIDPQSELGITAVAVGSCSSMSLMNIILCVILVLLIASLIGLSIKKYQEYHSSINNIQEDEITLDEIISNPSEEHN